MCDDDVHNVLIENYEQNCPFCDKLLFKNNIKFSYKCCETQLLEDINGINVCTNCGIVLNSIFKSNFIDFYENIFKISRKSIYFRKYHVKKIINNLLYEKYVQLSTQQIEKILKIFYLFNKIIKDINSNRTKIININYLLIKILNMMGIEHKIIIKKSKKTICFYNEYWNKILNSIGEEINTILSRNQTTILLHINFK